MTTKSSRNRSKKGYDVNDESVISEKTKVLNIINKKINLVAKNDSQKKAIQLIKNKEVSFIAGAAGTGKTFIGLATAIDLLVDPNTPYTKIYLAKSVKPIPDEEVGYIKGSLEEKLEPVMWSFMMNVNKLINESVIIKLIENNIIKNLPLAYIRGLSIDNAIIIIDETQNLTIDTLRTLMTRIGENSKFIALGDIKQIDIKNKSKSSLRIALDLFNNSSNKIGVMEFNNEDIVRNPLIKVIEQKFDEYESSINEIKNNKRIVL